MRNWIFFLFLLSLTLIGFAQELPRRVFLGIRMENLTDDAKAMLNIPGNEGILVTEVLPQSTAEKTGFKRGDILTKMDGQSISSIDDLLSILAQKTSGEKFSYELIRDNRTTTGKSVLQAFPVEHYPDLDVLYTESRSSIGLQRIILTRQKEDRKRPLIVFIGGIGCYSLDTPMDTLRSETQLLNQFSRSGYACARLEKPGMGDNARHCKPCNEVSFMEEAEGYVHAINTLKRLPDIDSNRVYIFGHSMGGVFAPMIAGRTPVRGIISYGTIGSGFIEYLAKTRRTIAEAYAFSPVETENLVRNFCECAAYYYVEKMTTTEAAAINPVCDEYLPIFDLRSRAYNDELYALNIPALWSVYAGKSLVLWGESDYISSREDHYIIDQTVNYYHEGNSTYRTISQADHGMYLAESFREATNGSGVYNSNVGNEVLQWLEKVN